jgi:putative ABC transport system permease protein
MATLSLLAFRSLLANRLRSLIVMSAVLLGIAAFAAVQLTNDAIARGLENAWRLSMGSSHLQLRSVGGIGFSESTIARVRTLPDVVTVAPTARKRVFYRINNDRVETRGFIELIGVDPRVEQQVRSYELARGSFVSPEQPNGIVVRESWASDMRLRLGDEIDLITVDGFRTFQIVGVLRSEDAGLAAYGQVVLVSLDTASRSFGLTDRVNQLSLVLTSDDAIARVRPRLAESVPESNVIRNSEDVRNELARSVNELQGIFMFFGATALFVAIFLILNTIEMTVVEQTQEIGRLRASGATRGQIFLYFLEQGLLPGILGSVLGALLGFVLATGLAISIERSQDVAVAPVLFSPLISLLSIVVGIVVVFAASISPSLRASRMNPIEAMQGESVIGQVGWGTVILGAALVILSAIGMVAPLPGPGARVLRAVLLFPFLTGLVFMSRATIVPLSALLGVPFAWLGGAGPRLAARNLIRHVGRTALTVAGFMVSLSMLVGIIAVAVSSVQAGERWTQSLIPSDYVVVSPVDQPPVFIGEFSALPDVKYVSPVSFFPARSDRFLVQLASVQPEVFGPGLEIVEGNRDEAVRALQAGDAVFLARRLALARGLKLGDPLPLQTIDGPRNFRIAAIVAQSFPSADGSSTVLLNRTDGDRYFGQRGFRLLMVEPRDRANESSLRAAIAEMSERYGMSATTAEGIQADVALAIWRLLALVGALVGIGILVGAFGTANTMLMNIAERARELSVLWAGGMSRNQLRSMVVSEAAMMGLIGGLLGTVVGAVLSILLVSFSRTSSFQPEYVFPLPAAIAGIVVAVLAAALAALLPARRLGRTIGP